MNAFPLTCIPGQRALASDVNRGFKRVRRYSNHTSLGFQYLLQRESILEHVICGIKLTYPKCNYADCVVAEWKNVSKGVGDMYTILGIEQETNTRHLLGLHHDPYMFHQANLMYEDADFYTTPDDITTVYSLLEVWHEYVVREYIRLYVTYFLIPDKS